MKKPTEHNLALLVEEDPLLAFLPQLIAQALAHLDVERIVLFGSRARRDHRKASDVDLAFKFPQHRQEAWGSFCAEVKEETASLLDFDLVNLSEADAPLLDAIEKDGITIYERAS